MPAPPADWLVGCFCALPSGWRCAPAPYIAHGFGIHIPPDVRSYDTLRGISYWCAKWDHQSHNWYTSSSYWSVLYNSFGRWAWLGLLVGRPQLLGLRSKHHTVSIIAVSLLLPPIMAFSSSSVSWDPSSAASDVWDLCQHWLIRCGELESLVDMREVEWQPALPTARLLLVPVVPYHAVGTPHDRMVATLEIVVVASPACLAPCVLFVVVWRSSPACWLQLPLREPPFPR